MQRHEPSKAALALAIRALPYASAVRRSPWICVELDADRLLISSVGIVAPAEWKRISERFMPSVATAVSRSSSDGHRAVLVSSAGPAGVDVETLDRIALNATPGDLWLAESERALVDEAPDQVLELACHWALKEAYGKALGVGLALPHDALAFTSDNGAIVLSGAAAPMPRECWRFGLYRRATVLLAVAYR